MWLIAHRLSERERVKAGGWKKEDQRPKDREKRSGDARRPCANCPCNLFLMIENREV
jgi:hypothetical protein